MNIILYGPPGSGKTTVGRALAERLGRSFMDTDALVEAAAGLSVEHIFARRGEAEFRALEAAACREAAMRSETVIALGGGALLNADSRAALERGGLIVCLQAAAHELHARLAQAGQRPLLTGDDGRAALDALLEARRGLYASFPLQVDTTGKSIAQTVAEVAALIAPRRRWLRAPGLEHEVLVGYGLLADLPWLLAERDLGGQVVVVADENVARHLPLPAEYPPVILPAGEAHKNLDTVRALYDAFAAHRMDRDGLAVAIGGGVVGDLVGFAAATYLRGIRWINAPTTLLAMVDASIGGKTGVNMPQGKNQVGAFHPPALVVADPLSLRTLPEAELTAGMAEVIKHGLIGDPGLLEMAAVSRQASAISPELVERALRVKTAIVERDPFERGERARLNFGHTVGHGLEAASGYRLRHGEAVAIGLAAETELAERIGLAQAGLAEFVEATLRKANLPVRYCDIEPGAVRAHMTADKKRRRDELKFALPTRVGEVRYGLNVPEAVLRRVLEARRVK